MLRTIISDFSRTVLFPKDPVIFLELNEIHKREIANALNKNVYSLDKEDFILSDRLYATEDFFELNHAILELYKKFKDKGVTIILFTNSYIPSHPDYRDKLSIFDRVINVHEMSGLTKRDSGSYTTLYEKYNIIPSESVFIDDDPSCLEAAKKTNIPVIEFPKIKAYTRDQLFEELRKAVTFVETELNKLV